MRRSTPANHIIVGIENAAPRRTRFCDVMWCESDSFHVGSELHKVIYWRWLIRLNFFYVSNFRTEWNLMPITLSFLFDFIISFDILRPSLLSATFSIPIFSSVQLVPLSNTLLITFRSCRIVLCNLNTRLNWLRVYQYTCFNAVSDYGWYFYWGSHNIRTSCCRSVGLFSMVSLETSQNDVELPP